MTPTSFNAPPNTKVSYFDMGLPGTQPQLNPEALLLALKLSVALSCHINQYSRFDRKHYFYYDQPLGYQITQYYHPLSNNGRLVLNKQFDGIDKVIPIHQIQLEQDTGKLNYNDFDNTIKLDLNRANIPLVEVITEPEFNAWIEIKLFLKKYQNLVKYLNICTGDLETGSIRVDVNVSINNGNRVEIKNLGSTGEIHDALKFEYNRQIQQLENGSLIPQETRGWANGETIRLRSKEDAIDYRYLPDSELPLINLHKDIHLQIKQSMMELPDDVLMKLVSEPYSLELKHARFLLDNDRLLQFYLKVCAIKRDEFKVVNNWIFHELLAILKQKNISVHEFVLDPKHLVTIIYKVKQRKITSKSAKIILNELLEDLLASVDVIINLKRLKVTKITDQELTLVCKAVIDNNKDTVNKIKEGKSQSLNYLLGLCMRATNGNVEPKILTTKLSELIGSISD